MSITLGKPSRKSTVKCFLLPWEIAKSDRPARRLTIHGNSFEM